MNSGIYIIRNLDNGKVYIGSAVNFTYRQADHRWRLNHNTHRNIHLQHAWNKHGADAFEFVPIVYCEIDDLIWCEQKTMDIYMAVLGWKELYNICPIAGSQLGLKHSAETKAKISRNRKGLGGGPCPPERKAKISAAQRGVPRKKHSPETKAKMSAAHKGVVHSPEKRAKLSASMMGKNKGKYPSREACAKMSTAQQARRRREKLCLI